MLTETYMQYHNEHRRIYAKAIKATNPPTMPIAGLLLEAAPVKVATAGAAVVGV